MVSNSVSKAYCSPYSTHLFVICVLVRQIQRSGSRSFGSPSSFLYALACRVHTTRLPGLYLFGIVNGFHRCLIHKQQQQPQRIIVRHHDVEVGRHHTATEEEITLENFVDLVLATASMDAMRENIRDVQTDICVRIIMATRNVYTDIMSNVGSDALVKTWMLMDRFNMAARLCLFIHLCITHANM